MCPTFAGRPEWCDLLEHALREKFLLLRSGLGSGVTPSALWAPGSSDLGKRFRAFIASPS
jgi:hypothetical protein